MLAPRKTLWSTPDAVMDHVIRMKEVTPLQPDDQVCDIGCGDGRCLIQWAKYYTKDIIIMQQNQQQQQQQQKESTTIEKDLINNDHSHCYASFVGIDIDPERIQQAQQASQEAREKGAIHADISMTFHCANALEMPHLFQHSATILFLYLIPRGLKLIQPILLGENKQQQQEKLRIVISYMAPLPNGQESLLRVDKIPVQLGTAW
eukprot:CAMPEP_0198147984 /NCGR_PEP_ID=MMETSP1443-20131203/38955_1 /TAXON_ID=186043 /ORGANISM="Entomoneis sp., Strain CCMP2396" /LENGTH=204 /DNA_ID=CAMNT_0043812531 /DNA_START=39 /DNA_END=650 /DNA_ORIENTATION=+